jgi:hypothetical protein
MFDQGREAAASTWGIVALVVGFLLGGVLNFVAMDAMWMAATSWFSLTYNPVIFWAVPTADLGLGLLLLVIGMRLSRRNGFGAKYGFSMGAGFAILSYCVFIGWRLIHA